MRGAIQIGGLGGGVLVAEGGIELGREGGGEWGAGESVCGGGVGKTRQKQAVTYHLLPTCGAARIGFVVVLSALLAEIVAAICHDGVLKALSAQHTCER